MLSLAVFSRNLAARKILQAAHPLPRGLPFRQRTAKWESVRYADCGGNPTPFAKPQFSSPDDQSGPELPRSTTVAVNLPASTLPEAQRMYEWLCSRPDIVTEIYPETKVYLRKGLRPSMRLVHEGEHYFYCLAEWPGEPALPSAL